MDDELNFTEDEIQEQLEQLGYYNVPKDRLRDFKRDLEDLIKLEKTRNSSWSTVESSLQSGVSDLESPNEVFRNGRYMPQVQLPSKVPNGRSNHQTQRLLDVHVPQSSGPTIHIEKEQTGHSHSLLSDFDREPKYLNTSMDTTASSERKIMKRKVLRKVDGQSRVFDESSVTESDFDEVEQRIRSLPVSEQMRPTTAPSGERRRLAWQQPPPQPESSRSKSAEPEPSYRLPDDYLGVKALIRPMTSHPHTKNVKKHDPVSRYQQYRESWTSQRAPGEKNHKSLRWNVREQMLHHDRVVEKKPQKVFVPNNYKVPSEKKRKNLRWHIRTDLAQGNVPPSVFD